MKRSIAILLLASLCICLLLGCNANENQEGGGIVGFYRVTVTGDKDSLKQPLLPFYRAGAVVKIKAHSVTDVSLHVFVNGKEISMSRSDSDDWTWEFEFVMPEEDVTVHLTYDQFYGKEEYTFAELSPGMVHLENEVTKVFLKTTDYAEKYSFIETKYSFKQEDIDAFQAITAQKLLKADNGVASQATHGNEYGFYYNTESHGEMIEVLKFNDQFFTWNDFSSWQAFAFEDENYVLPTIKDPDLITYSFKYDGRSSDVKRYDNESFSIDFFDISSIEFIPYEGADVESDSPFYLDSGYGKINLLSATIFELNGDYYEVVEGEEYWAYQYCRLDEQK